MLDPVGPELGVTVSVIDVSMVMLAVALRPLAWPIAPSVLGPAVNPEGSETGVAQAPVASVTHDPTPVPLMVTLTVSLAAKPIIAAFKVAPARAESGVTRSDGIRVKTVFAMMPLLVPCAPSV